MSTEHELPSDTPSMMLSHPIRASRFTSELLHLAPEVVGATEWATWRRVLRDLTLTLPQAIEKLSNPQRQPNSYEFLSMVSQAPSSTDQGGAVGMLAWMRHHLAGTPHVLIEDSLMLLLEQTDISPDVPVSTLVLPHPSMFLEFGHLRNTALVVPNVTSGDHILEGAYIERGRHPQFGEIVYVVLIGSPLGKANVADDATLSIIVSLMDPMASLTTAVHASYERVRQQGGERRATPDFFETNTIEALTLIVKTLLYLALPGTQRDAHPEYTHALAELSQVKSPHKRAKAERRIGRLYDYELVRVQEAHRPDPLLLGQLPQDRHAMRVHWRRGHYRYQPYGPQSSLRKLILLQPMLIAAGTDISGSAPSP